MYLVVGLGNPGNEYKHTRHNAGFEVLEIISKKLRALLSKKKKFEANISKTSFEGKDLLLVAPMTFMNCSGISVARVLKDFNVHQDHMIVIHDEMDLPFGVVRIKKGGGSAGHKGLESIIAETGKKDFLRVRIGIGKPQKEGSDGAAYVLEKMETDIRKQMMPVLDEACEAVLAIIKDGATSAMNRFNRNRC